MCNREQKFNENQKRDSTDEIRIFLSLYRVLWYIIILNKCYGVCHTIKLKNEFLYFTTLLGPPGSVFGVRFEFITFFVGSR